METTKVEPKKEEVKRPTAEDFLQKYQALCNETGWQIMCSPAWIGTNHGSFELVLQYSVGALLKKQLLTS